MTKTGLERFVEAMREDGRSDHGTVMQLALRLLAEEREQFAAKCKTDRELRDEMALATRAEMALKPPAPASLVEELKKMVKTSYEIKAKIHPLQIEALLDEYRPANDEGLREELEEWIKTDQCGMPKQWEDGHRAARTEVSRVVSRHPSPAKSALVEEGYHSGKVNTKSCNCVGPDKCTDRDCELVRRYHEGKEGGV